MDKGAWRAAVHGFAESDSSEHTQQPGKCHRETKAVIRRNQVNRRVLCGRQVCTGSRFKVTQSQVTQGVARVRASDLF